MSIMVTANRLAVRTAGCNSSDGVVIGSNADFPIIAIGNFGKSFISGKR